MTQSPEANGQLADRHSILSPLEWRVVDMAKGDGPRSLNADGLVASLARNLFGVSVPRGLANERLEALRRFSVRAWHWDLVRTGDLLALLDCGYSPAHALEILAHIAGHRGFSPSVQDDLLNLGSGLERPIAPRRPSSSVPALSAPQSPRSQWRGQSGPLQGREPCLCR